MNGFIQLVKNLRYLSKFSVKDKILNNAWINISYDNLLENFLYYVKDSTVLRPDILTPLDTVEYLVNSNASLARFGDGEIEMLSGNSIPYQEYDEKLAQRMKEILQNKQENLLVGINYWYFYCIYDSSANDTIKKFTYNIMPKCRKRLINYIDCNTKYCDAGFTGFELKEYLKVYEVIRKIWDSKDIVVVTCKNAVENIRHNIYNNASKIDYIYVPNKNAYSEYENVLEELKKYCTDSLIILMCGPLAKVLASDLCYLGYRALDLGHIMKSYDYHMRNVEQTAESVIEFYSPDI